MWSNVDGVVNQLTTFIHPSLPVCFYSFFTQSLILLRFAWWNTVSFFLLPWLQFSTIILTYSLACLPGLVRNVDDDDCILWRSAYKKWEYASCCYVSFSFLKIGLFLLKKEKECKRCCKERVYIFTHVRSFFLGAFQVACFAHEILIWLSTTLMSTPQKWDRARRGRISSSWLFLYLHRRPSWGVWSGVSERLTKLTSFPDSNSLESGRADFIMQKAPVRSVDKRNSLFSSPLSTFLVNKWKKEEKKMSVHAIMPIYICHFSYTDLVSHHYYVHSSFFSSLKLVLVDWCAVCMWHGSGSGMEKIYLEKWICTKVLQIMNGWMRREHWGFPLCKLQKNFLPPILSADDVCCETYVSR